MWACHDISRPFHGEQVVVRGFCHRHWTLEARGKAHMRGSLCTQDESVTCHCHGRSGSDSDINEEAIFGKPVAIMGFRDTVDSVCVRVRRS